MIQRILSSARGRIVAAVLVVVVIGVGVWAGISALGLGGPAHAGEVRFGAFQGVSLCDIGDAIDELPSGSLVFWSAVFPATVPIGHELIVERAKDGVLEVDRSRTFTVDRAIDCMGTPIADGPLYSGTYTFTIRDGAMILATGSLIIR